MKYIFFSIDGCSFSIADKLVKEGADVTTAQVNDLSTLEANVFDSDKDAKERRLSVYDGILDKLPAEKVIKAMKKIENKDDYFVFFDVNTLWKYSEMALEMGFTKGLFPTKEDWLLENDRAAAKKIVEKHYPDIKVAETEEFAAVEEAMQFLDESKDVYVLKGNSDEAPTIVPHTNDVKFAKELLIDALEGHKAEYEDGGFILERKIPNVLELTPEMFWWNGEPIATSVDFETKNFGGGDVNGVQVGCGLGLVVRTEMEDKVTSMAFPKWVHSRAKGRKGLTVWDCSMLYQPEEGAFYFGEFCSNRMGYDSLFCEIAMAGSATEFFEAIAEGKNPFKKRFGASVRGMNQHKHGVDEGGRVLKDARIQWKGESEKDLFIFDIKKDEKGNHVTCGNGWDLVVATGASDDEYYAIELAYEALEGFCFDGMYHRTKEDFLCDSYQTSIFNRFKTFDGDLFNNKE
jgi:hypothetical protein